MRNFSMKKKSRVPGWLKSLMIIGILWSLVAAGMYYRAGAVLKSRDKSPEIVMRKIRQARYIGFFPLKHRLDEMENVATILSGKPATLSDSARLTQETYRVILKNLLEAHKLSVFSALMNYLQNRHVTLPRYQGMYDFDRGMFAKAAPVLKHEPGFRKFYQTGQIPVIRNVLNFDMKTGKFQAELPGTAFLETAFKTHRHFLAIYGSSLDADVQKILYQALGKWEGAFLLADKARLIGLCAKNMNPFQDIFEAGSVIKLVTMAAAEEEGVSIKFPYNCNGPIRVGGRIFYDWKKHGKLNSMAESLACSCNLVFAETALKLGPEVETQWLSRFGIDNHRFLMGELNVRFGEQKVSITGDYALARAAIGLDTAYVTPYWLVRTADSLTMDGKNISPTLFTDEEIPENGVRVFQPDFKNFPLFPKKAVSAIKEGMTKAVIWKNGTGKRAAVPGMKLMLKTGTAGNSPYNSVLMGLFEINGRPYAFGLFLKNAGRAEFNGAAVLKSALERVRLRLMTRQQAMETKRP